MNLLYPIVAAVLQAWTNDLVLHQSLVAWMESILEGHNPESIPPLTLNGLDHKVSYGLALHVLPLLLRRAKMMSGRVPDVVQLTIWP